MTRGRGPRNDPTARMTDIVIAVQNADGFPETDFDKLDLTNVPWLTESLAEAERSLRRLRLRLEQMVEPTTAVRRCDECRRPIAGRADQRFCSSACRQRAYRRRQARFV